MVGGIKKPPGGGQLVIAYGVLSGVFDRPIFVAVQLFHRKPDVSQAELDDVHVETVDRIREPLGIRRAKIF